VEPRLLTYLSSLDGSGVSKQVARSSILYIERPTPGGEVLKNPLDRDPKNAGSGMLIGSDPLENVRSRSAAVQGDDDKSDAKDTDGLDGADTDTDDTDAKDTDGTDSDTTDGKD
jgi:hypothetical protein